MVNSGRVRSGVGRVQIDGVAKRSQGRDQLDLNTSRLESPPGAIIS
jgi:hypothetical protein